MSEWWDDPRDIRIRHRHAWLWDEECGATLTGVTPLGRHVSLRCVNTRPGHLYHRDPEGVLFTVDPALSLTAEKPTFRGPAIWRQP